MLCMLYHRNASSPLSPENSLYIGVQRLFKSLSHITFRGLDFSHFTELKNIYITKIYMKKRIQIINNQE